jgi:hypothetical protein
MMRIIIHLGLLYLSVLFSITFLPYFGIVFPPANFLLTIAIFLLFRGDLKNSLFWAAFGGILLDLFLGGFPYNFLITSVIILLYIYLTRFLFEITNTYFYLALCFLGSFLLSSLINVMIFRSFFFFQTLGIAIVATLFGFLLYFFDLIRGLVRK